MKTYSAKPSEVERKWYVVDATGKTLGRLSVQIANILRGKHRPTFTPHVDTGDFVVVVNAEKIRVTGKKADQMVYQRYSGYPGGLKEIPYRQMLERHPERILEHAVKGMIPHNRLGRSVYGKLKVYAGPDHPHAAQQPEPLDI
ncbi:MAG: 50S ribosomal protein L13 [Verrucomicrobiota bacterium]|jgi:large subunit ribosomal protein L13|nr:50S ribosomal protein L13 [Verrucomicrobiota bacterium]